SVSILPSGRVGVSTGDWSAGISAYLGLTVDARLGGALSATPETSASILESEMFREAVTAEFGMSLARMAEVFGSVIRVGDSQPQPAKHTPADKFYPVLEADNVSHAEAHLLTDAFSLHPRRDFMRPPPPHARADVYPWRF